MRNIRFSVVLAGLVVLHTVLSYLDGYDTRDAMTTGSLAVAAGIMRWLGGVRNLAGAVEWGRRTISCNKLIALLLVGMGFLSAWTSLAAGSPGSAVAGPIEIRVILPAFLVVGERLRECAGRMGSGRRQRRGSDDRATPGEMQQDGHWACTIQTSPVLGVLTLIYAGLTGLVEGLSPETIYMLLPCAYAIRVGAGHALADVLHARGPVRRPTDRPDYVDAISSVTPYSSAASSRLPSWSKA